jgi:HSP20 family protein
MSQETRVDIQNSDNKKVAGVPEQTRPGPVYSPAVDIFEHETAITVLADVPGVKPEDVEIDLRENVLTLTARVAAHESAGQARVLTEYKPGTFFRQFTLGSAIEQSKIVAKLIDGVLRLELPKAERARPRQIAVRTD